MSPIISVMVVDGLQLFRECLARALTEQPGLTMVEQSADAEEALEKARKLQPDVVLIGMDLPDNSALALTHQISAELPRSKLIILGLPEDEQAVLRFIEAGASGYILKEESLEDLIKAIKVVSRGEAVCSPRIAYSMFSRVAELAQTHRDRSQIESISLTSREDEILQLIANGLSNKEIAGRLFISLYTVKNHVHNILDKLQVRHRSDAVHYAFSRGILKARHLIMKS
jgi:DNA-binding NarL/FixJ family response regulator